MSAPYLSRFWYTLATKCVAAVLVIATLVSVALWFLSGLVTLALWLMVVTLAGGG